MDPNPQTRTRAAIVGAAILAGLATAAMDLTIAPTFVGGSGPTPLLLRLAAVLILPAAALAVGGIPALAPRLALLLPAATAWGIGHAAGLGRRAATLPLAAWWGPIAAVVTLALTLWLRRRWQTGSRGRRHVALATLLLAVATFVTASAVQRGRYEDLRGFAVLFAAIGLFPAAHWLLARCVPRRGLVGGIVFAVLLALVGGVTLERSVAATDWALTKTCATAPLVRVVRARFAADLPDVDVDPTAWRPYFGTPIASRSIARLRELGGPPAGFLFVTVDAMRGDMLGRTVAGRPVTPFLDTLAARGCVFSRAYAPAPGTHLSLFGFLSGWYPTQYLQRDDAFNTVPLITERLETAGVHTRGVYPKNGLTLEADTFRRHDLGFGQSSLHPWTDLSLAETFARLAPPADTARWFAYWHIMLPHAPYTEARPEFVAGSTPFELYASELRQSDDMIRRMVDLFAEAGWGDRMWLAVAADHGEEFGEHGATRHGTQLFDESVRVPLVIAGPGVATGRHDAAVSLVDLAPTLDQLFDLGAEGRPRYAGRSWLPLLVGLADADRSPLVLIDNPPIGIAKWNTRTAVASERWKLIVDERTKRQALYDLQADPAETRDVAASHPDEVRRLWAGLLGLRRGGEEGIEDPYREIESVDAIFGDAERIGSGAVLALLRVMKEIPAPVLASYVAYFAWFREPLAVEQLPRLFGDHPSGDVALAIDAMLAANGSRTPARLDRLVEGFRATSNPEVRAAILMVAERFVDDRLLADVDALPDDVPLGLDLGRALYRFGRSDALPDLALLRRAIAAPSPWIVWRAANLVRRTLHPLGLVEALLDAHARFEEDTIRYELVRALGAYDDPRIVPFLETCADRGGPRERQGAFTCLAVLKQQDDRVATTSVADPAVRAAARGFRPDGDVLARMAAPRASLPIVRYPEGTLLALFLQLQGRPERVATLELTVGDWSHTLDRTPFFPDLPVVLSLPPGTEPAALTFRLLAGAPDDVVLAGAVSLRVGPETRPVGKPD